jgi:AH receptor-interacting protein
LYDYPVSAKQLRDYYKKICNTKNCKHEDHSEERQHCCGFNLIEHGLGYPDLDDLLKNPKQLDFIFEIIRVEKPGEYKKDAWILSEEEQIKAIPSLKESGNSLFKEKKYAEALEKYGEALGYLEQLMLKEKPNDVEWNALNEQKIPILLNFSLCKFNLNEFYSCIEHTSSILEYQPNNVKALFRRAKSHAAVWNLNEARIDFDKCISLDSSLTKEVNAQLDHLKILENQKLKEEKEKFSKLFN